MLSLEDLYRVVHDREWATLRGEIEGDFLDCKCAPLTITDDVGKLALAKDVVALANAAGGFILFGIEATKSRASAVETISGFRPFREDRFPSRQYLDIIGSWVTPAISGLEVAWYPEAEGSTEGYGAITVPRQPEASKPFLVLRTIVEGKRQNTIVGYVERRRDVNEPAPSQTIAGWLRDGRNYQHIIADKLESILAVVGPRHPAVIDAGEARAERIDETVREHELADGQHYVLAAGPEMPASVRSFFDSGPESATYKMEHPQELRYAGWDLAMHTQSRLVRGEFREISGGLREAMRLYRDGLLIVAVAADSEFLSWGQPTAEFDSHPQLNTLALIELTYSFCHLYGQILGDLQPAPATISLLIRLDRLATGGTRRPVALIPGELSVFPIRSHEPRVAPNDCFEKELPIPFETFEPGVVAYEIVREIFAWFGAEASTIPYAEGVQGRIAISPARIVEAGKR